MKNPTRTYLNKFWAMLRAFSPEHRFSSMELNAAWRRAPQDQKPRLLTWMVSRYGIWQPMGPPDVDQDARS